MSVPFAGNQQTELRAKRIKYLVVCVCAWSFAITLSNPCASLTGTKNRMKRFPGKVGGSLNHLSVHGLNEGVYNEDFNILVRSSLSADGGPPTPS